MWLWKAWDAGKRRLIGWALGPRDDKTLKEFLKKLGGVKGEIFVSDDWGGYHRLIPEKQLITGKDLTFPIEQDNSNTRHYLARFRRRSKCTSRSRDMVDFSLRLLYWFQDNTFFAANQQKFLCAFG